MTGDEREAKFQKLKEDLMKLKSVNEATTKALAATDVQLTELTDDHHKTKAELAAANGRVTTLEKTVTDITAERNTITIQRDTAFQERDEARAGLRSMTRIAGSFLADKGVVPYRLAGTLSIGEGKRWFSVSMYGSQGAYDAIDLANDLLTNPNSNGFNLDDDGEWKLNTPSDDVKFLLGHMGTKKKRDAFVLAMEKRKLEGVELGVHKVPLIKGKDMSEMDIRAAFENEHPANNNM